MQYKVENDNDGFKYVLFGPASYDECQKEFEENLCDYRDHGYNDVQIIEVK